MRSSWLALAAMWAVAVAADAKAPDAPSRSFEGRDLFGLQWAQDPQIHPGGRTVAYVRGAYDLLADQARLSIWLIDADTAEQSAVASGNGSHHSPRWSPDGSRLAYVSNAEGGRAQLYVHWVKSRTSARITDLATAPNDLTWSPDGRFIAFTMFTSGKPAELGSAPPKPEGANWAPPLVVITDVRYRTDGVGQLKPGYTHTFIVSADGGAPRQITFGEYNDRGPLAWSNDGRSLYLSGNRLEGWQREHVNTEIYEVNVFDATIKSVTTRRGPDTAPVVSPDGSKIACLSFEDRFLGYQNRELYVMDRDGNNPRSLTSALDRTVDSARWAADSRSVYVQYTDHGVSKVARVSLDGKTTQIVAGLSPAKFDRPYSSGEFSVAKDGTVAYTAGNPSSPSNVAIVRRGRVTQLTHLNDEIFRGKTLASVRSLDVTSSFDQRPIDAWLVTPPNFDPAKKYPLILEIHGGPFQSYGAIFATDFQLYAAAGYIVLYANPRGSTSYGEEFANLIHHAFPSHDYDDLMSAVDAAIAQGFVDPNGLFVTGGSAGGVLTAWIVGRTNRFRAAATQKPVINWTSAALTSDIYLLMTKYWFGKPPWEAPEEYWKRSPLSLVGSVQTPTLVIVGDQDFRTPVADSEQYYQALQLRGIPTALVKVPGASHGGLDARPSQSAAKVSAILTWFERYRQKSN